MSPAAKRGPPTNVLSTLSWRFSRASHQPADKCPLWLDGAGALGFSLSMALGGATMTESWDDKYELLSATRPLYHNEDYWRFLVRDVWRIADGPRGVVDFGCGFGWLGLFMMPM